MLDISIIQQFCAQAGLPLQSCQQVAIIDSTNRAMSDFLLAEDTLPGWHLLVSAQQTHGRGQRGRNWISPANGNWYFSLGRLCASRDGQFHDPSIVPESMMIGQVCMELLESFGVSPLTLKAPNDILYQQRKLAGILIDNHWLGQCCYASVIGVGVNVRAHVDMQEIDQPWSCIEEIVPFKWVDATGWLAGLLIAMMQACAPKT